MRLRKRLSLFLFLFFCSGQLFSQDISGEWLGQIYKLDKDGNYQIYFPLHLTVKYDSLTGTIIGTSTTKSFDTVIVDCNIKGVFDKRKHCFIINETEAIKSNVEKSLKYTELNRFIITSPGNSFDILSGKCECITPAKNPLCNGSLQVTLRRLKENSS
jgi:hypothetical protein